MLNNVNPGSFGISTLHELIRAVTDLLQCTCIVKYFINTIFDNVPVSVARIYDYCFQSVMN
jgi:hypothetical protein